MPRTAMVGSYKKNPYNFKNLNLSSINLELGARKFPAEGMEFDFEKNFISSGYLDLYLNNYRPLDDTALKISRTEFIAGYCILANNLCKDGVFGDAIGSTPFVGTLKVRANWKKKLAENSVILAIGFYDTNLYINKHRQAYCDDPTI